MKPIVTLTLNPCIDGASQADAVRPTRKIRTRDERYDPGGGGINVARVIAELGGATLPVFLSGGATGPVLDAMLRERGFDTRPVPVADHTRISHAVYETSSGLEYRFVPEGPEVTAAEWTACLDTLRALDFDWLVASGSLPRGLAPGCLTEVAALAAERGARFVLDTSGPALAPTLASGGVYLAKPSIGEFRALAGAPLGTVVEIAAAAHALIASDNIAILAISMGHHGALLATADHAWTLAPPPLPVQSATGAGDAFLGAMVLTLARGGTPLEALAQAVAAGGATVLTPGTGLCRHDDVTRIRAALAAPVPV